MISLIDRICDGMESQRKADLAALNSRIEKTRAVILGLKRVLRHLARMRRDILDRADRDFVAAPGSIDIEHLDRLLDDLDAQPLPQEQDPERFDGMS